MKQKKRKYIHPLEQKLQPEENPHLIKIQSLSFSIGIGVAVFLSTLTFAIPEILGGRDKIHDAVISVANPFEKKVIKKKKVIQRKKTAGGKGKPGKHDPDAGSKRKFSPTSLGLLSRLKVGATAYTMMNETMTKDLEKVLKNTAVLSQRAKGKAGIGIRRGKVNAGYRGEGRGFGRGKDNGPGIDIGALVNGPSGPIKTGTVGKLVSVPRTLDIGMGESSSRSRKDIMRTVRSRMPGLRHIYNKHLKSDPGFEGKVTLRFVIAPSGQVLQIQVVSSTTSNASFDQEVKRKVRRWKFGKVKSGQTTVTLPFTFSE